MNIITLVNMISYSFESFDYYIYPSYIQNCLNFQDSACLYTFKKK